MEQTLYQKLREQYAGQGLQLEGVIFPKEQELVLLSKVGVLSYPFSDLDQSYINRLLEYTSNKPLPLDRDSLEYLDETIIAPQKPNMNLLEDRAEDLPLSFVKSQEQYHNRMRLLVAIEEVLEGTPAYELLGGESGLLELTNSMSYTYELERPVAEIEATGEQLEAGLDEFQQSLFH